MDLSECIKLHSDYCSGRAGGVRFVAIGENLSGANLSDANLSGANLRWAILRWANLSGASLNRANLSGASLSGANLSDANLSDANLFGADLFGADLRWANLFEADLRWADLRDANLTGANLTGANLTRANLFGANLSGANLSGATLGRCIGNMKEIKTAQFDRWSITWTRSPEDIDYLQIGCQRHPLEKWKNADPRWIAAMDPGAAKWWEKYGQIVIQLVEASPAVAWENKI